MKKNYIFSLLVGLLAMTSNAQAVNYDLYIAGVQVTSANKGNITGTGISGSVIYNSGTNTLTLNGATISTSGNINCIENKISGLTIELKGTNSLKSGRQGIYSNEDFSIKGINGGSLNVEASAAGGHVAIYHASCDLIIENATVTANGSFGITGRLGKTEVLTIKNSTVRATGKSSGSIRYLKDLKLVGCEITSPAGAAFSETLGGVAKNGVLVTEEVVISPATALETVEFNAKIFARDGRIFGAENAKIYDILGRDVTKENGNLNGVFVVKTTNAATKIIVR